MGGVMSEALEMVCNTWCAGCLLVALFGLRMMAATSGRRDRHTGGWDGDAWE